MRFTWAAQMSACIVMLAAATANAQGGRFEIEGILLHADNTTCQDCPVTLEAPGGVPVATTLTNGAGSFTFKELKAGTYIIRIRIDGYEEIEQRAEAGVFGSPRGFYALTPRRAAPGAAQGDRVLDVSKSLERYPRDAVEMYKKASKSVEKNKPEEAVQRLEEAIRIAPDFYDAHLSLGKLFRTAGRLDDAEREWIAAKDLNESSAEPLVLLSALYTERGAFDLAVQAGEEAVRRDSRSVPALLNLGLALYQTSQWRRAETVLKMALDLTPDRGPIRLLLANVYLKQRDWDNLRLQLDSYLRENPDGPEREAAETMRRQLDQALAAGGRND